MSKDLQSLIVMVVVLAASAGIGTALILKVPQRLHTPLMSMTNALSAVTILGALLLFASDSTSSLLLTFGAGALIAAGFNLVGGFAVTARMLRMFKR